MSSPESKFLEDVENVCPRCGRQMSGSWVQAVALEGDEAIANKGRIRIQVPGASGREGFEHGAMKAMICQVCGVGVFAFPSVREPTGWWHGFLRVPIGLLDELRELLREVRGSNDGPTATKAAALREKLDALVQQSGRPSRRDPAK